MDWHPTEEDLTLYAWGDAPPEQREAIERHLAGCAACADTARENAELLALASTSDVPEPDATFEDRMWARIEPRLAPTRRAWAPRHILTVGAWAAAIGGVAVAGTLSLRHLPAQPGATPSRPTTAAVAASSVSTSPATERVLLTALDSHFAQTEVLLVELLNAPEDQAAEMSFERATADDLVQSGRLYRVTAAETGDRRLADVIDEVQTVLTEVARTPATPSPAALSAIRSRIQNDDLLFKVRAVTNDIRDRRQTAATPSEGAL